ncbi:MAG TPA: ASKHA domain-containing protein [Candidatus Limiplasma sp.]|nr:ASKHA domain-containing protein [Candidatus Limiplasma sp.]HRX09743.1 ASKHA domain-containing protein [Candidatus Limiplasma sp.]
MTEHTLVLRTQETTERILFAVTPLLMDVLQARGIAFAHPCGGRGVCGKCAVDARGEVSAPNAIEMQQGVRLSCQLRLLGDCEVTLQTMAGSSGQPIEGQSQTECLLAADIGTTTLELQLIHPATGAVLRRVAAPNPQAAFAADVIGRITAAAEGKGEAMRSQLLRTLREMIGDAYRVSRAVMTGNTVMLYLLTGKSPKALALAPFAAEDLFGRMETVLGFPTYLPPCTGAFTGADLTCAILHSGMTQRPDTALLCDIGTNGEIALWHRGTLFITSTAIGPAFEGAGISCGMGGVAGAVDKVWAAQGRLDAHVIGGGKALGVCGSGLIDAVAAMRTLRWIDPNGTMDGEAVPLAEGISLTQQDIRQVQLAKAAVAAGIELLMDTAGVGASDIHALYIAGGFGSHLDPRSAAAIGLYPAALAPKVRVLGNAALEGAARLLDTERQSDTDAIVRAARPVQLSGNPQFADQFIRHMNF